MDETTAGTLLPPARGLDRDLGAMFDTIAAIPGEALRRRSGRAVADLTGVDARDLVFPIERLQPALRPAP